MINIKKYIQYFAGNPTSIFLRNVFSFFTVLFHIVIFYLDGRNCVMKNENGLYFLNHDLLIRTLDSNFSTSHFTILFGILKYALSGSYKHIYLARQGMHKLLLIVCIGATVVTYYYYHCKQENITCFTTFHHQFIQNCIFFIFGIIY